MYTHNHNGTKYILSNGRDKHNGKIRCDLTLPTCIINNNVYPGCCLVKKNKPIERPKQPQPQPQPQPQTSTYVPPGYFGLDLDDLDNRIYTTISIKKDGIGGENSKHARSQYKAALMEKKDVKKLYKIAKEMGIKITKKRNGKTSYIKKETIVKKLCDAKYPNK